MYGVADDAKVASSPEMLDNINDEYRTMQDLLREAGSWRAEEPPEVGEWGGGHVDDSYDDFAQRYLFAFWRLAALGTTTSTPLAAPGGPVPQPRRAEDGEPDVRVIRLTAPARSTQAGDQEADKTAGSRVYHHRWPVRMHKGRQWYPSLQQHRVIWRGPYIKGPADAPLLVSEKAYRVDG